MRGDATSRLITLTQAICVGALVLTLWAPFPARSAPLVTSLLLLVCTSLAFAAGVRLAMESSGARRAVYLGLAATAFFSLAARLVTTVLVTRGGPSTFLSPDLVIFVVGAHLPLIVAFSAALGGGWRGVGSEVLVDTLLLVGAAALIILLLPGPAHPAELHTLPERAFHLLWRAVIAGELFLVALLVAWRGGTLGVRTSAGVALGTVAFAVTNGLHNQAALAPGSGAATSNDALWLVVIASFAFALERRPAGDARADPEEARREAATLRAGTIIVAILLSAGCAVFLGFLDQRRPGLAIGVAVVGVLLALRAVHALWLQRRDAETLSSTVVAEREISASLEHRVEERTTELAEAQRVLQRMWVLGQQVTLELHPARVLQRFLEAVLDIAQADGAALDLIADDATVRVAATIGLGGGELDGRLIPIGQSVMKRVMATGKPWAAENLADAPEAAGWLMTPWVLSHGFAGLLAVPVMRSGERIGAVILVTRRSRRFTAAEVARIESMTDMLSVALANAELVETLRQAEWRFRTLFRAAPDAVLTVHEGGVVREANDVVRAITGLEPSRMVGRPLDGLVIADDRTRLREALAAAFAGTPSRVEVRFECDGCPPAGALPAGAPRVVALAASRLPETEPPTVLLIGRDITAEREMRARLLETERLAAIGELVAGVAHEVNNPLGSISAFAQLLLGDDDLSGEQRESVEVIRAEASRASQVVRDLLAFARRGEGAPRREPVDLNEVVERSLRLRGYQLRASHLTVERCFAPALPTVPGDARQLQQVVLNLVTNSIQAMAPQRGGVLRITTRAEDGQVLLEVADTGPGIPAGARQRIFEPFFTTKPEGEGTGLGLSVSYGIVTDHGGTLSLAETSPAGTRFVVALPLDGEETPPAAPEPPAREPRRVAEEEVSHSQPAVSSPLAGLRVLVVDDEQSIRRSLEVYGRTRGISVLTAEDGAAALRVLETTPVDAVLCDLRMPGMDGFAFLDALRREHPALVARTVFMTGDLVGAVERATPSGRFRAFRHPTIHKPFTFERVEESLLGAVGVRA